MPPDDPELNFEAAALFLKTAREAHESGDRDLCTAARKMVALALGLSDGPRPTFLHTGHLAPEDASLCPTSARPRDQGCDPQGLCDCER